MFILWFFFFFFSSRRRHTRSDRDWSSDVCSSDLAMAYTTVGIKSQVNGQIVQVHFKEGQDVRQNDLLFTIDPRPFEAALRQAEAALRQRQAEVQQAIANVERDTAQLANARVQERRYKALVAKELVAREQH